MDAVTLFRLRHHDLEAFAGRWFAGALTEAQLRSRPLPGVNSIAWLLWHMARGEDWGVNRLVVDGTQVLEGEDWQARLGAPLECIGTGMADDEVGDLSSRVDLPALEAYWRAVMQRTDEVAAGLQPEDLDAVLDEAYLRRVVVGEGAFGEDADKLDWVRNLVTGFYAGRPKGWYLTHFALTHPWGHYGEGGLVRGLLGGRSA